MLLNIKWTLSWTASGGCTISLLSVAPNRVSMLFAVAMDGSLPLTGEAATSENKAQELCSPLGERNT